MAASIPQTPRMTALQTLQNQLPVASQKVAQGIQAARDIQLQQAVAKAPTPAAITPVAQQTAAAATAQAGQQQVEAAKQMVQQAGQFGELKAGEQQMAAQQQIAQAEQVARQQEMTNVERLGRLDMAAKKELYDSEIQFKKDEAGRTLFNERQLIDYAARNARSEEEYRNYAQRAEILNKRKLQAMETAYRIIEEDLRQQFALAEQRKDQAAKERIAQIRRDIQARVAREKNRAANRAAMWQAGGMIVGAAAGVAAAPFTAGTINPVTGAMIGAQMGGAVGGLVGSQQE